MKLAIISGIQLVLIGFLLFLSGLSGQFLTILIIVLIVVASVVQCYEHFHDFNLGYFVLFIIINTAVDLAVFFLLGLATGGGLI